MMRHLPLLVLAAALAAIVTFAQGFRIVDTVGLLIGGAVAGGALASLAARRRRRL